MAEKKYIYFISDLHLVAATDPESGDREKRLLNFLDSIKERTEALYILGDLFDFWYEWKNLVPKGGIRFFAKMLEWKEEQIPVHFLVGNHDLWVRDYFEVELGWHVYKKPFATTLKGKEFFLAHGDEMPGYGRWYHFVRHYIFAGVITRWLCDNIVSPNFVTSLGKWLIALRYKKNKVHTNSWEENNEVQVKFAQKEAQNKKYAYIVMGHRHHPIMEQYASTTFVNLGDWTKHFTYGVFDGVSFHLNEYKL